MNIHARESAFGRLQYLFIVFASVGAFGLAPPAAAQTGVTCTPSATNNQVASTGLAEQIGNLQLSCTGGTAGTTASGDLFITMSANVTNNLSDSGNPQFISVNAVGAAVTGGTVALVGAKTLQIPGLSYTIPTPSSLPVTITIGGIRVAVASVQNGAPATVTASLFWSGFSFAATPVTVATGVRPLLSSVESSAIACTGSPLPSTTDFPGFFAAGTSSSAVRVTGAIVNAFTQQVSGTGATNGVRILVQLSGYPAGTQVFVPNALAGNTGSSPTSAGQFGSNVAGGGQYTQGANQLLLVLVNGADQNGVGGSFAMGVPVLSGSLSAMTQLTLSGGSAYAVYEVVDHNPNVTETVQIPLFEANSPFNCANPSPVTTLSAVEAPVSMVAVASNSDPLPRYISSALASDCQQIGDCSAGYIPVLATNIAPVLLAGSSLGPTQTGSITVLNNGGGAFSFADSVTYQSGSGWLTVTPTAAEVGPSATLHVVANPGALQPGTYNATVTIDAGALGKATVPVVFTVGSALPTITGIVSAASFQAGAAIAPGSYVALYGTGLAGANVTVTFNNLLANVIYDSAGQINLIIPAAVSGSTAPVVVSVNGVNSLAYTATLTPNAPGIFTPGIVNADGSVNSASNPAATGTYVAVYLTGLAIPVAPGSVTVSIGSQTGIIPLYAGAQGTETALDQINVTIPVGLAFTGNSAPLAACIALGAGQSVCSNAVTLYVR